MRSAPAPTRCAALRARRSDNDLTTDAERDAASCTCANALTVGGLLFLEVREAGGSVTTCCLGSARTATVGEAVADLLCYSGGCPRGSSRER